MKIVTTLALGFTLGASIASACGELFINKGGYHVSSRSMEFGRNMAFDTFIRYIGQKQKSNIIIDLDKIPTKQIASWSYQYGFVGRGDDFRGGVLVDGLNTQGVTVSALYLPGVTEYPTYNKNDKRDVISIYENAGNVMTNGFKYDLQLKYAMKEKSSQKRVVGFVSGSLLKPEYWLEKRVLEYFSS
jgi:penicillin V acylase-like amidase (Ntn superfamily)